MAFESLTDKLQNVFKNLRSKGRLTEEDVKAALKEVKMALLEADVSFKVVKQFVKSVEERAVGQDVMNGLNPGQMVIKIVNEELIALMGSETTEIAMQPGKSITVIMMAGLQGAGKTTATAKIAAGSLLIDPGTCKVQKHGEEVPLSKLEYRLLLYLAENKNHILSKEQILEKIWDSSGRYVDDNTVSVNISRLRAKIEDDASNPVWIKTVHGIGYIWKENP